MVASVLTFSAKTWNVKYNYKYVVNEIIQDKGQISIVEYKILENIAEMKLYSI